MSAAYRYKAFISYAHEDAAFAASLHARLEKFVIPKALRTKPTYRRLGTFFRDRDELASGGSLSTSIVGALESAEYLIVICSATSARSVWVNREVETFLGLRPLDNVLLVVADNVASGDVPHPEALGAHDELLAADARPSGDGQRTAFLKIVAGLLHIPLDSLVRRDQQRQRRRIAIAVSSVVVLTVAAALSVYFVSASAREADARREQAESFANLFVGTLDDRIARYEKVGALDADLSKALDFFATLKPEEMDPKTLDHYRIALLGIGTVRIRQGKPLSALEVYERARELSQSMVERESDEASRWYDLAMLTYYIGEAHWEMQHFNETADRIVESLRYAQRAVSLAPDKFEYQLEVVFELNNLGATNTRLKKYDSATEALNRAIEEIQRLRTRYPDHAVDLLEQEVEAISWLAEISQKRSQYKDAFGWHEREIGLRKKLIEATHNNPHHIERLSDALGYYADSLTAIGNTKRAVEMLNAKVDASQQVVATDTGNAFYRERLLIGKAMLASALIDAGDTSSAQAALDDAERGMTEMVASDMQASAVRNDLIYVNATRAYLLLHTDSNRALDLANASAARAIGVLDRNEVNPIVLTYYLRSIVVMAAAERLLGRSASQGIEDALGWVETQGSTEASGDQAYKAILLCALGRGDEAEPLIAQLDAIDYRPVFYRSMLDLWPNAMN